MANIKTLKQSLINKKETIIFAIGLIAGAVINGMLIASSTILLLAATVLLGHVLYKNKKLLNFENAARKLKDVLLNNGSINNFIIGCVVGTIAGVLFDVVGFVFASLPLMLLSTAAIVGCLVYKHVTRDIKVQHCTRHVNSSTQESVAMNRGQNNVAMNSGQNNEQLEEEFGRRHSL